MSYSGMDDMVANVGAGFIGAFVHMGTNQTFVNIIHFVPHILIFLMTLFIGALAGVLSFSVFLYTSFVSFFVLVTLQKLSTSKVEQSKLSSEVFKRT